MGVVTPTIHLHCFDLQQGFCCADCKNNLRTMTLAAAVTRAFGFAGGFKNLCCNDAGIRQLAIIQINSPKKFVPFSAGPAQTCAPFVSRARHAANELCGFIDRYHHSFRHVGHVPDSKAALKESMRVLNTGGHLFYTVPIVIGRLTRTRRGFPRSYHGKPGVNRDDCVVQTEYRRRFLVRDFRGRISRSKADKSDLPCPSVAIHAIKPKD